MAVVFHLISLVVRTARVVHNHDKCAFDAIAHNLAEEFLRSIFLRSAYSLAVLVGESISKLLNRFAESHREHVVDGGEHLSLALVDSLSVLSLGNHIAKFKTKLTQLACNETRDTAGVLCRISFRHNAHRHHAIFIGKVGNSTESTTIIDRTLEEELHASVVDRLLGIINNTLEHEVSLLKLVVEEEIVVRELNL